MQDFLRRSGGRRWIDSSSGHLLDFYMLDSPREETELDGIEEDSQSPPGFFDVMVLGDTIDYIPASQRIAGLFGVSRSQLPVLVGYLSTEEPAFCRIPLAGCINQAEVKGLFAEIVEAVAGAATLVLGETRVLALINRAEVEPIRWPEAREIIARLRETDLQRSWTWSRGENKVREYLRRIESLLSSLPEEAAAEARPSVVRHQSIEPADLLWQIETTRVGDGLALRHILSSPSGRVPIHRLVGTTEPQADAADRDFSNSVFPYLEELLRGQAAGDLLTKDQIGPELEAIGEELWLRLVPEAISTLIAEHLSRARSLQLETTDRWIPWEMLVPERLGGEAWPPFLGCRVRVGRWFPKPTGPASRLRIRRVLGLAADWARSGMELPFARIEMEWLRGLIRDQPGVTGQFPARPERDPTLRLLSQEDFDWIHFAGHAAGTGDRSTLQFADRGLRPDQLGRNILSRIGQARPLIFLNACLTARQQPAVTGVGGWPSRLVSRGGCGALICTQWPVRDRSAHSFAASVFRYIFEGRRLGEALRRARTDLLRETPSDPTPLAYAFYGHPNAIVGFGSQP